jgi:uncharacterized protein YbjT (DUF2867 family)
VRCLVIGATGYVGSRLVPRLLDDGHAVRCLVRNPDKLGRQPWANRVEALRGDMADPSSVAAACTGVDAVFYLVHAMDGPEFVERDRRAATTLAEAAGDARRVVYLGGLQPSGPRNSAHLASRREVGEILLAGRAPTAVLQAGIVVGAGSASFGMIRALAGSGPVLVLPDRAWNHTQPVAIDDVLHHLTACLTLPRAVNATFDIGGPEVLTFGELVAECAVATGLPRPVLVPVPLSAPRLTARALGAVLPVDRHLVGPLLESMEYELVCRSGPPAGPPPGGPTPYAEAVRRAVAERTTPPFLGEHVEGVAAPAPVLWDVITGLGGDTGWYTVPGAWALRGGVDRLLGGVGARRTRPDRIEPGAAWDWWRVEEVDPGERVLLRAETRLPGTARLELRAEPDGPCRSRYVQRVLFTPDGPAGRLYWHAVRPGHDFVFGVMARTVAGVAAHRWQRR